MEWTHTLQNLRAMQSFNYNGLHIFRGAVKIQVRTISNNHLIFIDTPTLAIQFIAKYLKERQ